MSAVMHSLAEREHGALHILARSSAAAVRAGAPTPLALEGGLGLLRDYYEQHPEVSVAETAARCVRRIAAYPNPPERVDVRWDEGPARMALVLGVLLTGVLGSIVESEGGRFDPHRANALFHAALLGGKAQGGDAGAGLRDTERLLRQAGRVVWSRWTARLARLCVLSLRLSEWEAGERDRFADVFFEIVPLRIWRRVCRRADVATRMARARRLHA